MTKLLMALLVTLFSASAFAGGASVYFCPTEGLNMNIEGHPIGEAGLVISLTAKLYVSIVNPEAKGGYEHAQLPCTYVPSKKRSPEQYSCVVGSDTFIVSLDRRDKCTIASAADM